MKSVKITVLDEKLIKHADSLKLDLPDNATIFDAIAALDAVFENVSDISLNISLLQDLWNSQTGDFYSDIGIEVRDEKGKWQPIFDNPNVILSPSSA